MEEGGGKTQRDFVIGDMRDPVAAPQAHLPPMSDAAHSLKSEAGAGNSVVLEAARFHPTTYAR